VTFWDGLADVSVSMTVAEGGQRTEYWLEGGGMIDSGARIAADFSDGLKA